MSNTKNNSNVTKSDLEATKQELLNKLSSKEELQKEVAKLATKEELRKEVAKLATKEDLRKEVAKLATKEELQKEVSKLATKKELQKVDAKLEIVANQVAINTGEIKILHYKVDDVAERLDSFENKMDKKFDLVIEILDGLTGKIDRIETDVAAFNHTFLRHETRLDDHEKRISNVEGELNISN